MEKKITYSDVRQAFEKFLESSTEETLLKALDGKKRLETLEKRAQRLYDRIEDFCSPLRKCGETLRKVLYPEEWAGMKEQYEGINKTKIKEDEKEELEKIYTLLERLDNGLEDVLEYIEDPSPLTEEDFSGVERLAKDNLPTLAKIVFLVNLFEEEIMERYSSLLSFLEEGDFGGESDEEENI